MLDGKKSTAERIVYDALAIIAERTARTRSRRSRHSIKTLTPVLEVRSRRVGGATYQVPGRGARPPRPHARRPLARRVRPPAPREDDGPAPRQRADGRARPSRAARTSARTTSTAWRRPTRPSRTTAGSRRPRRRARAAAAESVGRSGARHSSSPARRPSASPPPAGSSQKPTRASRDRVLVELADLSRCRRGRAGRTRATRPAPPRRTRPPPPSAGRAPRPSAPRAHARRRSAAITSRSAGPWRSQPLRCGVEAGEPRGASRRDPDDRREVAATSAATPAQPATRRPGANGVRVRGLQAWEVPSSCYCLSSSVAGAPHD